MPILFTSGIDRYAGILRRNPPKHPAEYKEILERLTRWITDDEALITENAKMNKPVAGEWWVARGFAMLSSTSLARLAKDNPNAWGLTEAERQKMMRADFCPQASAGCKAMCLVDAGQMGLPASREAQIGRSLNWIFNKESVRLAMVVAITRLYNYAKKRNSRLGFRLNVTSDVPWEQFPIDVPVWLATYMNKYGVSWVKPGRYRNIMEIFDGPYSRPQVMFYDYTKIKQRMVNMAFGKGWPRNYHLTWSLDERASSRETALWVLQNQISTVAVPFDRRSGRQLKDGSWHTPKDPLPETLTFTDQGRKVATFKVVDSDTHDLRFKDPPGVISGLRFKVPKKPALAGVLNTEKAQRSSGFIIYAPTQHPDVSLQGAATDNARTNPRRRNPRRRNPGLSSVRNLKIAGTRYNNDEAGWNQLAKDAPSFSRLELIRILVWNDRNGCYTDADCRAERMDPMTKEDAVEAIRRVAHDEYES